MESHRKEGTPPRSADSVVIEEKPADDKTRRDKTDAPPAGDKAPARR